VDSRQQSTISKPPYYIGHGGLPIGETTLQACAQAFMNGRYYFRRG